MKRTITTILFSASLLLMSCNEWLDVKPQAQTTQDALFETQKGFRDVLTGAYIRMNGGNIYGSSLMWGHIEYMANNWDVTTNNPNNALSNLKNGNYADATVRGWLDNIYQDLYKVIADVNGLLEVIDDKRQIFSAGNYELTKGEALALRAFCHFDALRLFGPMPHNPGGNLTLPYVTAVNTDIHPTLSFQDFTNTILADLSEAEALLREVDPIMQYSIAELNPRQNEEPVMNDNYLLYRQLRFNYYAVLALKARVYMWLASSEEASRSQADHYARMVVAAIDRMGRPTFRLGNELDRVAGDYTMSPEHIMALHQYDLAAVANGNFGNNGGLFRYDFNIQDGFYYLNNLFPVNERTSDIRWREMWNYKTTTGETNYVMYGKFMQREGNNAILQVPLLRLSEMYLILTECATSKEEAEATYSMYCEQKGIPFPNGFDNGDWVNDRRNKIVREYVREFYAEGQSFFTYKRLNVASLPASWTYTFFTGSEQRYVVPKPLREIDYNNN